MRECRKSYFRLSELLGTMTVIPPLPIAAAKAEVEGAMRPLVRKSATPPGLTTQSA